MTSTDSSKSPTSAFVCLFHQQQMWNPHKCLNGFPCSPGKKKKKKQQRKTKQAELTTFNRQCNTPCVIWN